MCKFTITGISQITVEPSIRGHPLISGQRSKSKIIVGRNEWNKKLYTFKPPPLSSESGNRQWVLRLLSPQLSSHQALRTSSYDDDEGKYRRYGR